jgi:hypothetical protein
MERMISGLGISTLPALLGACAVVSPPPLLSISGEWYMLGVSGDDIEEEIGPFVSAGSVGVTYRFR